MLPVVFLVSGFAAAFLQTSIGFGSAIVMMNILPYFIPSNQAIIICQITSIVLSSSILIRCFKSIRWDISLPLLMPTLIATAVVSGFSTQMDTSLLKTILGFVFIILSIYFSMISGRLKLRPTLGSGIAMGLISGTMNGLFSMGGPPAILYLAPSIDDKTQYLATSQSFFIIANLTSLTVRFLNGQAADLSIPYCLLSCTGALLGTFIGLRLVARINATLIKKFIYAFVGINGLIIVLQQLL